MKNFDEFYTEIESSWLETPPIQRLKARIERLNGRPLVCYGAGRLANVFLDACDRLGVSASAVCDRCMTGSFRGIPIITLQDLKEHFSNAVVLVCSYTFNNEICSILDTAGFAENQVIPYPAQYPYFESPDTFAHNIEGYRWAYNFFQDDLSRQLVLDRIALYLEDRGLVPNTASDCYYESEIINLGEHEVFVDGGAYIGDTAVGFIKRQKGKYSHIYAFEPSDANFRTARNVLNGYPNVDLIHKGLWSSDIILTFFHNVNDPSGAKFTNKAAGSNPVAVTSLDCLFASKSDKELPTFIKMDIEGSENEALTGSAEIIRKAKPKLAICAYHKPEDIYRLPRTILKRRSDYRFVLRQHDYGCYETVLYAV